MVVNRGRRGRACLALLVLLCGTAAGSEGEGERPVLTLASTTSTQNSGLLDHLLPLFRADTGYTVRVVAVGTGQALRLGERGDADVLLVHDRVREERFVAEGFGTERSDVMYNDFVLVGPADGPIAPGHDVTAALESIARARAPFVSRGDDSGTHKAELRLWRRAGIDPTTGGESWYREAGTGMGATLNTAVAMGAYTLSDRGTWLSFRNRRSHEIVVEGDPPLFNPYSVIPVSPERHPHVHYEGARALVRWLVSERGQAAIGAFRRDGQQLFVPNAVPGGAPGSAGGAGATSGP